ncbi:hypothetical protein HDU93_009073 [Gonapodya sp. JEL0774]|nr:hypothetical protein HDU93_009073 [Gonapodya sp. JEL0774]
MDAQRLIEAVDGGDVSKVVELIATGVNPNARKKITLSCSVKSGTRPTGKRRVRKNVLRMDDWEETFEDVFIGETDTVEGESALALGIISRRTDIVRVLLEGGADPNNQISWRNADSSPVWNRARWDKRWARTYKAKNALLLALGRGVTVTDFDGKVSTFSYLLESGKLRVNKPGGHVVLKTPSSWKDAYDEATMVPTGEILSLLVQHGAIVTADAIAVAKAVDPVFAELLTPSLRQSHAYATDSQSSSTPFRVDSQLVRSKSSGSRPRPRSMSTVGSSEHELSLDSFIFDPAPRVALASGISSPGPLNSATDKVGTWPRVLDPPFGVPSGSPPSQSPSNANSILTTPTRGPSSSRPNPTIPRDLKAAKPIVSTSGQHPNLPVRSAVTNANPPTLKPRDFTPEGILPPRSNTGPAQSRLRDPSPGIRERERDRSAVPGPHNRLTASAPGEPSPILRSNAENGMQPQTLPNRGTSHTEFYATLALELNNLRAENSVLRSANLSLTERVAELERTNAATVREAAHIRAKLDASEQELSNIRAGLMAAFPNLGGSERPLPALPLSSPQKVNRLAQVTAEYFPRDTDEMELRIGQEVFCHKEYEDGWGSVGLNYPDDASL